MEWLGISALLTAVAAALKVFWPARSQVASTSSSAETSTATVVDHNVLAQFLELTERLSPKRAPC